MLWQRKDKSAQPRASGDVSWRRWHLSCSRASWGWKGPCKKKEHRKGVGTDQPVLLGALSCSKGRVYNVKWNGRRRKTKDRCSSAGLWGTETLSHVQFLWSLIIHICWFRWGRCTGDQTGCKPVKNIWGVFWWIPWGQHRKKGSGKDGERLAGEIFRCKVKSWSVLLKLRFYFRERVREEERERNIYVRESSIGCLLYVPWRDWTHNPGTFLTRNWTSGLSLCRATPNQLNHTGPGKNWVSFKGRWEYVSWRKNKLNLEWNKPSFQSKIFRENLHTNNSVTPKFDSFAILKKQFLFYWFSFFPFKANVYPNTELMILGQSLNTMALHFGQMESRLYFEFLKSRFYVTWQN